MVSGRISRDRARPQGTGPIAIDARAAIRPEFGGVERWARELSARLPALRPGAYAVLAPPGRLAHRAGHAWEQVVLPARAARLGARALLCPANLAPIAYGRSAVVIHDAAVLRHPGWYSRAYAAWQRVALPAIARRARRVMTVSEFSRRELNDLLGVDADVVPGGVDERFGPHADTAPARRACGLDGPYVLCVASHTARKNLGALVPAARALAAEGIRVAVAGGHRPQFAREPGLADLRLLGHMDDALLPGLYAGAESFALPSRYEGFGLTVLEAMACGTPVVAADAGALPETCGGAALRGHLRRVARGRRLRRRPRPLGHGGPVRRPRAAHVVPAGGRPRRRAPSAPCSRCTRTRSSRSTCAGTTS